MRLAVTGSIATDHLLTFDGRFRDSLLEGQTDKVSLSFLASDLQVRGAAPAPTSPSASGVLGLRPLLVGAVGQDAKDYLGWLERARRRRRRGARQHHPGVGPLHLHHRHRAQPDRDLLPGRDGRGRRPAARARSGALDLVVVAPDDPTAMLEHSQECRDAGTPFAADPSQQLAFMDGECIKLLVEGATYLFSNGYEAGLIHEKTGWSADEVLDRVGTRITTHGVDGVVVERKGEPDVRVGVCPAREIAEPTGVGDAFRSGFLAATAWGLGLERACQVGATLATLVVETVGTQEYAFSAENFTGRLAEAYGDDAAGRGPRPARRLSQRAAARADPAGSGPGTPGPASGTTPGRRAARPGRR